MYLDINALSQLNVVGLIKWLMEVVSLDISELSTAPHMILTNLSFLIKACDS
jgi:hypothetical protein